MFKSVLYCQICGSELEDITLRSKIQPYCPNCNTFSYLDPKVAIVVLIENSKNLLLVKRDIEPYIDHWSFPSGYVDRGENTKDAAIREIKEETCLDIKITQLQGVYSGKGSVVIIVYTAIALDINKGKAGEEVKEIKWFPVNNLPSLPFPYDDEIIADYINNI